VEIAQNIIKEYSGFLLILIPLFIYLSCFSHRHDFDPKDSHAKLVCFAVVAGLHLLIISWLLIFIFGFLYDLFSGL
jgi:hypothetical protein